MISGVTHDFNDVLRNATHPDPGAFEFDGVSIDAKINEIDESVLFCPGSTPIICYHQ